MTLFGIVETKAQAHKRAQRIVRLIGALEDAPDALTSYENDIRVLEYFVERSAQVKLDPNDLDGYLRLVGDNEDLLTEEDCLEMRANTAIWRRYPFGWLGCLRGELYAASLHPKEVAYLRELQEKRRDDIEAVTAGSEQCKAELDMLRAIGPLPDDVAARYCLTPDGKCRPVKNTRSTSDQQNTPSH